MMDEFLSRPDKSSAFCVPIPKHTCLAKKLMNSAAPCGGHFAPPNAAVSPVDILGLDGENFE